LIGIGKDKRMNHPSPTTNEILATKPSPDSKLGIEYHLDYDGFFTIMKITDTSIFAGSGLKIGQEVETVNGTPVKGMGKPEVRNLLASLGTEVVFAVRKSWKAKWTKPTTSSTNPNFNCKFDQVPLFLESHGVSLSVWERIFFHLDSNIVPAAYDEALAHAAFEQSMKQRYTSTVKSFTKIASNLEHVIFQKAHVVSALGEKATRVSTNAVTLINALLKPYDIVCLLDLVEYTIPYTSSGEKTIDGKPRKESGTRIMGLEFIPISDY